MSRCCAGGKWPKSPLRPVDSWHERWPLAAMVNDCLKESCFHNEKHCVLMRSSIPVSLARNPHGATRKWGGKSSRALTMVEP